MPDDITAFQKAVLNNDIETVRKFLDDGFDVNAQDENGITGLLIAAYSGHIEMVRLLLACDGIDLEGDYAETPLVKAAQEGLWDIVDLLIAKGADASVLNVNGFTLLQSKWHSHILNLVEKAELPTNPEGLCYGGAATALFAAIRGEDAVKVFMESVNASNKMTPEKMKAFEADFLSMPESKSITEHPDYKAYMDTMALLQNIVVNFKASQYAYLLPPNTPLQGQQTEIASAALFQPDSKGQIEYMKNTMKEITPVNFSHYTAEELQSFITEFVDKCTNEKEPMGMILRNQEHGISCTYDPRNQKWLLFDMNNQPVYDKFNPAEVSDFIWSCLEENTTNFEMGVRVISSEYLAAKRKLDAHFVGKQKNMLIYSSAEISQEILNRRLMTAVSNNSLAHIDLLAGSNVSSQALSNCLFNAIARGKPDIVRILLAHHASAQMRNQHGETPFAYAKMSDDSDLCNALIEGAMNSSSWPEFFNELVVDGDCEFILHAIKQPGFDPNQPDKMGNTPLHMVARSKLKPDMMQSVLDAMQLHGDLNPYFKNNMGKTAIDLINIHQSQRLKAFTAAGVSKFTGEILDKKQHLKHTTSPLLTAYAPSQAPKEPAEPKPSGPGGPFAPK